MCGEDLKDDEEDGEAQPVECGAKISVFVHSQAKGYQEEHCLIEFQSGTEKDAFKEVVKNAQAECHNDKEN